jgi:hypothetical protein
MFHKKFSTEEKKKIVGFGPGDMVEFFEQPVTEAINWGGNDDPGRFLTIGGLYKVREVEIHSYHTKVFLEDIEGKFNSVSFRLAREKNEKPE